MYLRPSAKVLTVSWQWLPQPPHLTLTDLLFEGFQLLRLIMPEAVLWALLALAQAEQGRTVSAHQSRQCPGG